jgi:hypothetical protein
LCGWWRVTDRVNTFLYDLAYALDSPADWTNFKCRLRGHPRGEVFYNPGGYEPNHDCVDCGEDLG